MKITRIKQQTRNSRRYAVYLDGAYSFALDSEAVTALGLAPGTELTEADVARITREDQLRKAKEYAVLLLSYRARTIRELRERLVKKGFADDIASAAIGRLVELKLLDDTKFAQDYTADRIKLARRGKWVVRGELMRLGVGKPDIEQAMETAPDEAGAAKELVAKYRLRYARLEPEVRKRRLYALLARRGFSPDTIRQALDLPED